MDYAKVISVMKDMRTVMGNQKKGLHALGGGKNKNKKDREDGING